LTPTTVSVIGPEKRYDLARIHKYAPEQLIGRGAELRTLTAAWKAATEGKPKKPNGCFRC
jgi:hypothetical protein